MQPHDTDDPNLRFATIFLPPECRAGHPDPKFVTSDQAVYPFRWLRSVGHNDTSFTDRSGLQTDLRQLGLMMEKGGLNEDRAKLISDYIWSRRDDTPSFFRLLKWLRDEVDNTPPQ